jgi:hypothetical protein
MTSPCIYDELGKDFESGSMSLHNTYVLRHEMEVMKETETYKLKSFSEQSNHHTHCNTTNANTGHAILKYGRYYRRVCTCKSKVITCISSI